MKIFISPDSFKGSMSSIRAAEAIKRGINRAMPDADTYLSPMADGGEGTLKAMVTATKGKILKAMVRDPLGRNILAEYGITGDGKTAIIELANASGIERLKTHELDPLKASTFGTGQLIADALEKGYRDFLICLGGSATNDGGTGLLKALGFRFLNADGEDLPEGGYFLKDLAAIDNRNVLPSVFQSTFQVACDVRNPLLGNNGAAAVFGPQKGAAPEQVLQLDYSLNVLADCIKKLQGIRVHDLPGSGAAGGTAAGLVGLLGAELKSGLQLILEKLNLRELFEKESFDLMITGEGKLDGQTASGKVVAGLASFAQAFGIPVIAIAGKVEGNLDSLYEKGLSAAFSITDGPITLEKAMEHGEILLENTAEQIGRILKIRGRY